MTVKLRAAATSASAIFNGYVTRFAQGGTAGRYYVYQATVRPWLWFLTRTADCRIFQDKTVPDIVKEVFEDHPIANFEFKLFRSYRKLDYCVQYRETDFNFVAPPAGAGRHLLVLRAQRRRSTSWCWSIRPSAHDAAPGCEALPFFAQRRPGAARHRVRASDWRFSREVQPGKVVLTDYDFERPSTKLEVEQAAAARATTLSDYEVFDYPGDYVADGRRQATTSRTASTSCRPRFERCAGHEQRARASTPGRLFKLTRHPRDDQNARVPGRQRGAASCSVDGYEIGQQRGGELSLRLHRHSGAASSSGRARRTPKPFVQGPQTAVVVGPGGRGDLHRQVRPREGAVPLGPLRQEGREELVLGARVASLGGQELRRRRTSRASARR